MNKRTKWSLAVATLVTTTLTNIEVANANELAKQEVSSQVVSETRKTIEVTKEQVDSAKAKVGTAKDRVETATTNNKNANEAVQQTSQQVTDATKAVKEAEANKNATSLRSLSYKSNSIRFLSNFQAMPGNYFVVASYNASALSHSAMISGITLYRSPTIA